MLAKARQILVSASSRSPRTPTRTRPRPSSTRCSPPRPAARHRPSRAAPPAVGARRGPEPGRRVPRDGPSPAARARAPWSSCCACASSSSSPASATRSPWRWTTSGKPRPRRVQRPGLGRSAPRLRRSATCSAASSGAAPITAVRRTEAGLRDISAEQIVAGVVRRGHRRLVAASAIAWPVLLLGNRLLAFPLFAFVVVTLGLLGYRVGAARRDGGARHVRRLAPAWPRAGRRRRRCRASSTPRSRSTAGSSTSYGPGSCTARCWCPRPCSASCRAWPTPATTCAAAAAAAGSRCSRRCAASPASTSRSSTTRSRRCPRSTPSWCGICLDRGAALLTLDTNLAKVAALAGVRVHEPARARPRAAPAGRRRRRGRRCC